MAASFYTIHLINQNGHIPVQKKSDFWNFRLFFV